MDLDRIERYMNRELHPAAARAMAHEALDDSDLFEELTAVALVQAALESPATTDRSLAQSALDDEDLFDTLVARGAAEAAMRTPAAAQLSADCRGGSGRSSGRSSHVLCAAAFLTSDSTVPTAGARRDREARRGAGDFAQQRSCSPRGRTTHPYFAAATRRAVRRSPTALSFR